MLSGYAALKTNQTKVVLAYSGGLDTSVIVRWLANKGMDVICYCANVGQKKIYRPEEKALNSGAKKCIIKDLTEEFVKDFVYPAVTWNRIRRSLFIRHQLGSPSDRQTYG